jgi:son of sevenless-like protein
MKPSEGRAPNLQNMIQHFNEISSWIATAILNEKKLRDRVKVMENIVKIAQHARELNNFHLLTAIISGINGAPVNRLRWTKEKLQKRTKQILESLEDLMSPQKAFRNYREALKQADGACIPYV